MKDYELVCIIHPDLDESAFKEITEKIQNWVNEASGTVNKMDIWGRKRLAYSIRKQREGQYVLFNLSLPPANINSVEKNLQFLEPVIRYLFTLAA